MAAPGAWAAGLRAVCPACGKGPMFRGFLALAPSCSACGADFSSADAGDGPAVFVMFAVGAIVAPLVFVLQFALQWPTAVVFGIASVVAIALSLALLRPFKAVLFALQWRLRPTGEPQSGE